MKASTSRGAQWLAITAMLAAAVLASGQDAHEALGPRDRAAAPGEVHPLTRLMARTRSSLRPELRGKHPRVYVTESGLTGLRQRAKTTHRDLWQDVLHNLLALKQEPAAPPAQARRAQNQVGIAIAEAALAYHIEGDAKYLAAAKRYMDAAASYDVWGYTWSKPNVDLAAGHLLYGMGWGYDLLYNDLSKAERATYRAKIARQANLLAEHFAPKPGRTYSYSQNHVFIPIAGLAVAAYAVYDEVPEAPQWAALARAIFDRVLATYSPDGYYYEGFEYWIFATPWIVHYLDAHAHATGEDLFDHPGLRRTHLYAAHSLLPGGQYVFDFGDIFEGPFTRAGKGKEYARSHPGGRFHTNYNVLYRLAARFRDPEAQSVAGWMKSLNHLNAENYWSLFWYDPAVPAPGIGTLKPWHYFSDHEVVFWRSDWTEAATAFAFKAGPPEGHHTAEKLKHLSDWHLSSGHAHPDANSFIIYAHGRCLTGDSGYAGVPLTEHHNTLLVNGRGQGREGQGHDAFRDVPYDRLDGIRIADVRLGRDFAYIRGQAAAAYEPELGVNRFDRSLVFLAPDKFMVWDEVEAEQSRVFTTLVHADGQFRDKGKQKFAVDAGGANLRVTLAAPEGAVARVEPNWVTAPGPPGSVDKGDRQQRGERLAISTAGPVRRSTSLMILEIEPGGARKAAD